MQLTVSIINHNSLMTLPNCLGSLERNLQNLRAEVVVVDNLCDMRAGPLLRTDFPWVKVITNSERLGFSANHNQVIRRSAADYVLLLNPDVILDDSCLDSMWSCLEANPDIAVCGPLLVDEAGSAYPMVKHPLKPVRELLLLVGYVSNFDPTLFIRWFLAVTRLSKQYEESGSVATLSADNDLRPPQSQAVPWISGACMLFRRSALQEIGLLDERFFLYFEETDWCLRANEYRGRSVHYLPHVSAVHIGGTSTRPEYFGNLLIFIDSALAFYEKHLGRHVSLPMTTVLHIVAGVNWVRWSLLRTLRPERDQMLQPWIRFSSQLATSPFAGRE